MILWALVTAAGQGFAAVSLTFAALVMGGMILFAPVPLLFFGVPALCAALHVGPGVMRRMFWRLDVRPGTWPAVGLVLLSGFHWIAAIGAAYAVVAQPVPAGVSEGSYYLLMPMVIVVLAGGGYFVATFERLRLSGAATGEISS